MTAEKLNSLYGSVTAAGSETLKTEYFPSDIFYQSPWPFSRKTPCKTSSGNGSSPENGTTGISAAIPFFRGKTVKIPAVIFPKA